MVIRFIYINLILIFRYKRKTKINRSLDRWMIKIDKYEVIKHKFCLIQLDLKYSMYHGQCQYFN